jgi:hypothetical protein
MSYYLTASGERKIKRTSLPFDIDAARKRALSMRGRCRRHNLDYALNILRHGQVVANGCPKCHPGCR